MKQKDRELLERIRHIAEHQEGLLITSDGMRWYPTEILTLIAMVERKDKILQEVLPVLSTASERAWVDQDPSRYMAAQNCLDIIELDQSGKPSPVIPEKLDA